MLSPGRGNGNGNGNIGVERNGNSGNSNGNGNTGSFNGNEKAVTTTETEIPAATTETEIAATDNGNCNCENSLRYQSAPNPRRRRRNTPVSNVALARPSKLVPGFPSYLFLSSKFAALIQNSGESFSAPRYCSGTGGPTVTLRFAEVRPLSLARGFNEDGFQRNTLRSMLP